MTIATTRSRIDYLGTGTVGPYPYPFRIFAATDLLVSVLSGTTGLETVLTYVDDYSVSGAGSKTGGDVTLVAPLVSGDTLVIRRVLPLTQPMSLQSQGPFSAKAVEDQFDRVAMQLQQLDEKIASKLGVGALFEIIIDPATFNISAEDTLQLTATGYDASGNELSDYIFTWTSSDEDLATVDENGLVTGVGTGTVTITATSGHISGTSIGTADNPHNGSLTDLTTSLGLGNFAAVWDGLISSTITLDGSANLANLADALGSGRSLVGIGTPKPSIASGIIASDALQNLLKASASASFDLSTGPLALVYIGTVEGFNRCVGLSDDPISAHYLLIGQSGTNIIYTLATGGAAFSGVAVSGTRYCIIAQSSTNFGGPTTNRSWVGSEVVGHLRGTIDNGTAWVAGNNVVTVGGTANGQFSLTHMAALAVIRKDLTAADMPAIIRYALAHGATILPATKAVQFFGDSLFYGTGTSNPATDSVPAVASANVALSGYQSGNLGVNGRRSSELLNLLPGMVLQQRNTGRSRDWVWIWIGTNDNADGVAAATIIANIQSLCTQTKAAGFTVGVINMMKRDFFTGAQETVRTTVNAALANFVGSGYADAFLNAAAICDPTDPAQSSDGSHPNTTKAADLASGLVAAMVAVGV